MLQKDQVKTCKIEVLTSHAVQAKQCHFNQKTNVFEPEQVCLTVKTCQYWNFLHEAP
jgi:hypothetical protein